MGNRASDKDGTTADRRDRRYKIRTFFVVFSIAMVAGMVLAIEISAQGRESVSAVVAVPLAVGGGLAFVGGIAHVFAWLTVRPTSPKAAVFAAANGLELAGLAVALVGSLGAVLW